MELISQLFFSEIYTPSSFLKIRQLQWQIYVKFIYVFFCRGEKKEVYTHF